MAIAGTMPTLPFLKAKEGLVEIVDVPSGSFLMIDGVGAPPEGAGASTSRTTPTAGAFQDAIEALFSVAYTIRFGVAKRRAIEYHMGPLEGTWEGDLTGAAADRNAWRWTLLMAQPDELTEEEVMEAVETARSKHALPGLDLLRFERWAEGPSAQVMYVGPYASEGPTISLMHEQIAALGRQARGRHHEIYLGDPRRADPSKLRTLLRQPVTPVGVHA